MVLHETKIRLSKALLLRDAFTGEPVSSGIRIRSLSGGRVEKKTGGYFLFLDVEDKELTIETESPIYQPRCFTLKVDEGAEVSETLLYPSPSYPLRAGNTTVRGRTLPGRVLKFHLEDERSCSRLIGDYKKGEAEISFYRKGSMKNVLWHIRKKQGKTGEYFALGQSDGESEVFRLGEPLETAYLKKDTVIYPAQETIADENGLFYLLLGDMSQELCKLHYFYKDTAGQACGEAKIMRAKENYVDL
jgi:hypothetical protein